MIKWAGSRVNGGKIQGSRMRWLVTLGWAAQYKHKFAMHCTALQCKDTQCRQGLYSGWASIRTLTYKGDGWHSTLPLLAHYIHR